MLITSVALFHYCNYFYPQFFDIVDLQRKLSPDPGSIPGSSTGSASTLHAIVYINMKIGIKRSGEIPDDPGYHRQCSLTRRVSTVSQSPELNRRIKRK